MQSRKLTKPFGLLTRNQRSSPRRLSHDTSKLRKFYTIFSGPNLPAEKTHFYRIKTSSLGTYSVVAARWSLWTRPIHVPWRPGGPKWYDWRTFFFYRLLLAATSHKLVYCLLMFRDLFLQSASSTVDDGWMWCCWTAAWHRKTRTHSTRDERRHTSADGWTRKNFVTSSGTRVVNSFSSRSAGVFLVRTRTQWQKVKAMNEKWAKSAENSPQHWRNSCHRSENWRGLSRISGEFECYQDATSFGG